MVFLIARQKVRARQPGGMRASSLAVTRTVPLNRGGHGVVEMRQQDVVLDQLLEGKPPAPVLLAKGIPGPRIAERIPDVLDVEDLCRVRVHVTLRLPLVCIRLFFRSALPSTREAQFLGPR